MDQSFPQVGAENKQSGQISIPKPELRVSWGDSLTFLPPSKMTVPGGKGRDEICPEQKLKPTAELGKKIGSYLRWAPKNHYNKWEVTSWGPFLNGQKYMGNWGYSTYL